MDKIIERALQHWYASEHELYGDPLPALMGIVGESGELCDLWKKKLYKPGFEFDRDAFLDELGDCLFYAAVLCHYHEITIQDSLRSIWWIRQPNDIIDAIIMLNYHSACGLAKMEYSAISMVKYIDFICQKLDITLDQLSELNYAKLNERASNGEGYNRGEKTTELICNYYKKCSYNHDICEHKSKHLEIDDIVCGKDICYHIGEMVQCIPYTDNKCSE